MAEQQSDLISGDTNRKNCVKREFKVFKKKWYTSATNVKKNLLLSADVKTDSDTSFSKNGVKATFADLSVGQKVIVVGFLDKTANILNAKAVKIVK